MVRRVRRLPADDDTCAWIQALPPLPPARRLGGTESADCIVIGAGFTGLAAARRLATQRPNWRVVVLEAQRVGGGASGRNSGFVVDVAHWQPRLGVEGNQRLVRLARFGIAILRELVEAHGIECAWSELGRLHGAVGPIGQRHLDQMAAGLDALQEPYQRLDTDGVAAITGSRFWGGALHTPGTVLVQPAALVRALAATLPPGVTLFEQSPVRSIEGRFVVTAGDGQARAPRLLVTVNGFAPALGFLEIRVFPLLTFGSLTRVLTPDEQAALGGRPEWGLVPEERMGTTVRRTRDQRILIRNTVHYTPSCAADGALYAHVRRNHEAAFRARFPALSAVSFEHTWGGVMGMSLNGAHAFGALDEGLYAAGGYNGVGIAMGTAAGTLLADLVVGADSPALGDMRATPRPAWIPPEPLLGVGVRATIAGMRARAGEEVL